MNGTAHIGVSETLALSGGREQQQEGESLMQTITLQAHVEADGILRLEVPVGMSEVALDVVVTFHSRANGETTTEDRGWPEGFH
jgi:hypothetical protein